MKNESLKALLKKLSACGEAGRFVGSQSLAEAWKNCKRADWMLWLCGKMVGRDGWPTRKQVVLAACACAETSLKFVKEGELRPAKAIETVRAWARGEATLAQVRDAADAAAYAADVADAAANAAANAAYAAADAAAYAAAYAAYAAYAAAYAAYAADAADAAADAAYAAAYAAYAAAYAANASHATALAEMADIVRGLLKIPEGE
jgi:hypothetical protein